jgi:glycerate-2-kinase
MAQAVCAGGDYQIVSGVVTGPRGAGSFPSAVEWIEGAHPLPDGRSIQAALRALELAGATRNAKANLLVLLSGGGSAMLAVPAKGLSLEDKRRTADALMQAGADISQLNCVRKHLSAIKGGRLAAAAGRSLTLALSDVHDDDPGTIASGPTAPDPATYQDAIAVLDRLGAAVPRAVRAHLERGAAAEIEETPKPGDPRLTESRYAVVGNRGTAMGGAADEAKRRGYVVRVLPGATRGEARRTGRTFVETALAVHSRPVRLCVIGSGETTVTVRGDGRGGRNQEFVLGAAGTLADTAELALAASVGTDGVDGPTDAAGAFADSTTASRASALAIDIDAVLDRNDAYGALARLGGLIKWGPTLTNVGDVHVVLTMRV